MASFVKKNIFGLDISDSSIEALQLTPQGKLKAFGRIAIEEGIVKDGFILDKEKLAKKVKEVISQAGIKASRVILSLPESKVFTHLFQLPIGLKGKELRNVIESEAGKTIPLEISKVCWDYQITSLLKDSQLVLFVGTLKEIVDDYLELLSGIGLRPVAFEIESLALRRALLKEGRSGGIMIIDIGARTTNISIFDKDNILRDSIVIPIAGNQFTKVIARKLKIPLAKAEKLKRNCGLDEKKEKGKVADVLEKELQLIIKKARKSIEYYGQEIEEVFLVGGSARTPKIARFFSLSLGFKANIGISPITSQLKKRSVLFNTVIGLALRGLEKNPERAGINLLPRATSFKPSLPRKKTEKRKISPFLGIGFGILAFAFLAWTIYGFVFKPLSQKPLPLPKKPPIEEVIPEEILPPQEEEMSGGATSVEPLGGEPTEEEPTEEEPTEEEPVGEVIRVIIQETETGWLNVRGGPATSYPILIKIYPGESYPLLAEFDNWYKIELEEEQEGWIFSRYATTAE